MKKVLDKLDELIARAQELRDPLRSINSLPDAEREDLHGRLTGWMSTAKTVLRYSGLSDHADRIQSFSDQKYAAAIISLGSAELESAREVLTGGFLGNVRTLLEAELFGSIIEQADELFRVGHLTPAAVLGRIVIERWVRRLARDNGIAEEGKRASVVNDDLRKADVYATARWRLIQGYLDVGNSAAHGKENEYSEDDVKQMLDFARANCV